MRLKEQLLPVAVSNDGWQQVRREAETHGTSSENWHVVPSAHIPLVKASQTANLRVNGILVKSAGKCILPMGWDHEK